MLRPALLLTIFLPLSAISCERNEKVVGPLPPSGAVTGLTAHFEGLDVTLSRVNASWYPRDEGIAASSGEVFVTVLIHIVNGSSIQRRIDSSEFHLTTLDHNDVVSNWEPFDGGRQPFLAEASLAADEQGDGWLTFRVPQDTTGNIVTSQTLDAITWSPSPELSLSIPFPSGGSERTYEALFFGQVTDSEGTPLTGATVTLVPVNPYLGPLSTFQDCIGGLEPAQEYLTDSSGWYEGVLRLSPVSFELCISVTAIPPDGRDLGEADSSGAWIHLGVNNSFLERPELRIDLTLH